MITANRTLSHLAWQYRFDEHLQCKILETRRQDTDKDAMYDQKLYADAFEAYLAAAFQPIMMPDRLELLRQYIGALLSPSCAPDVWAAADQFHRLSLYGHAAATATGPLCALQGSSVSLTDSLIPCRQMNTGETLSDRSSR